MINLKFKIKNLKLMKGFTLIELLMVIAIIGILAGILFANFIGVRQRARDSQRKADLNQIQSALEFYRSDVGSYLSTNPGTRTISSTCPTNASLTSGSTTYMQKIPCDPSPPGTGVTAKFEEGNYGYEADAGLKTYSLFACIENLNDNDPNSNSPNNNSYANWCTPNRKAYVLKNP